MDGDKARLPRVGRLFGAAWRLPFQHLGAVIRFGVLPLLVSMIAWPPSYTIEINGARTALTDGVYTLRDLIGFLVALPFAAAFAAAWLRLAVSGNEAEMGRPPIAIDRRTWYVAWAFLRLLLVALGALALIVIGLFPVFGHYGNGTIGFNIDVRFSRDGWVALPFFVAMIAGMAAFGWFMLRFAMVIPAAALGAQAGLGESWRMTRPLQIRLLIAFVLLIMAFSVLAIAGIFGLLALANMFGPTAAFYIGLGIVFVMLVFAHALWAGLLGAAYRALTEPMDGEMARAFS